MLHVAPLVYLCAACAYKAEGAPEATIIKAREHLMSTCVLTAFFSCLSSVIVGGMARLSTAKRQTVVLSHTPLRAQD